ncbi:hybrid sensor histidine kinase/response regulator [Pleurocapsa sp. PCC 7319]|uniref:hybrid sensor histidine kinase/response regulator n=1 Tax=Pleurocapsa sp. PCC 7319 TaxID=118161 RepID=UPI00034C2C20|nr:ATP-binding protein [Pleurocapsa sp. PCC 7319]
MKLPQLSLTTKIANYFLLLALITVSIVGGVAYFRARGALKQAAFDRLSVAATLKEQEIARWFEDQQRDFLQTTEMPDVQANLNILLNSSLTKEKQQAYQVLAYYLTRVNQIKPNLREIFILDRSNKIILSTNKEREQEYEILANITYIEQVEIGANFAPIFYVSPVTGKPAITLAKPLENRQGMILVDLDLERIDQIVREKTGLGESGESYLVGSLISKNSFIAGKSESSQAFPDGINSAGIDAAMSGMSGYGLYRNYSQSSVLGVYRWLNEQDIALLVEISQEEAFDPARKLASAIVLVGLVSVLGLLIGVNWLSLQLSLSRQQLEQSSYQLQLKAQEAEAANRAKSQFLANMSHELRTPLNAILGFSQLMSRDTSITTAQQESLDIINRSGEHLLNLINDVLEMSKIEAGKITLNNTQFDLHRLLQTIQEMFKIKAEAKGLWFKFLLADNLPQYVVSDSRKLRQLLINLLSNAVKFTQIGGVTLRAFICQSNRSLDNKAQLCFEVSDTGKGIAPEELNQLFDPFVQTASGIQSEGGTGLGLSISRQFAELMGGNIQATSIVGEGSAFAFNIQVELPDSSEVKIVSSQVQIKQLAPGQPDYRIAVVDDNQTNRLALVKLLQSVGFHPRTADNGMTAIALWETWQPDLIWMDMRMPVMDGYEATRHIKSHPDVQQTIIIALTASAFEEQREKILAAGCDDFVPKPFPEQIIFDKLTLHLGVKFIYERKSSNSSNGAENKSATPLSIRDLSPLSPDLITQLNQAAIAVDAEQIEKLIMQIPDSHQHITQAIAEMLAQYDFDAIIDLTESSIIE